MIIEPEDPSPSLQAYETATKKKKVYPNDKGNKISLSKYEMKPNAVVIEIAVGLETLDPLRSRD